MNIDFGMKYLSDDDYSVSILFFTDKVADLLIYDIEFINEEDKNTTKGASNAFPVSIIKGEKNIIFKYPNGNSASFNKVAFSVKDNTLNMRFKVRIKYDKDALPDIRVL